jgi:alginate O-acetyltransferase complex protein AlgI
MGVFATATFAFLVAPALVLPEGGRATVLVVGWDLVLSSYSYCVEVAGRTEAAAMGECLFFLLVNPALVFSNRGRRVSAPGLDLRAALRAAVGMLVIFVGLALIAPACAAAEDQLQRAVHPWAVDAALFGALRLLLEYARQSGLASLQIGMIRQLGYEIPERFDFPFLARDPLDFWRRWNTYVGGWLLRYVFRPVAARYRGHGVTWRLPAAQALGILAAFSVAGLLHDAFAYAATLDLGWAWSRAFLAVGAIAAAWSLGGRVVWRRATHGGFRGHWARGGFVSRAAFWAIATGCAAWGWR